MTVLLYRSQWLTKVFSGSCWESEEDSMVVWNQSQACQRRSDSCISVGRREKRCVITRGRYYNSFVLICIFHSFHFHFIQLYLCSKCTMCWKLNPQSLAIVFTAVIFCLEKNWIFQTALSPHVGWVARKIGLQSNVVPTHLSHFRTKQAAQKHNEGFILFLPQQRWQKQKPETYSLSPTSFYHPAKVF